MTTPPTGSLRTRGTTISVLLLQDARRAAGRRKKGKEKMAANGSTDYQAKYFAYALTREGAQGVERLQQSLLNATVDLNPHQVEAALFALRSPLSKGVLLADEVGLGKTIEAGLVLCQLWAERKRKLLIVCPAALRKQWQCELEDKFNLPCQIVDAKAKRELEKAGFANPYEKPAVLISSYAYAAREAENIKKVSWNCVVIDEAHKLRNSYRESSRMGQAIRWALEDRRKLLLTATPLQNNLTELYGISTLIDPDAFGDLASFRSRFANVGGDLDGLRERLKEFSWRTLRKDVMAYVKYTERIPMTESFECSDRENQLYLDVSAYLQDETTYAFPQRQRSMLTLLVRKLLASSTSALIGTLLRIKSRLEQLREGNSMTDDELLDTIIGEEGDLADELAEDAEDEGAEENAAGNAAEAEPIDLEKLDAEIVRVKDFLARAYSIGTDTKTRQLVTALDTGWKKLAELGAAEKAVVFTESRRTMHHLKEYLEAHGYAGEVVCFSGGGRKNPEEEAIYQAYKEAHSEDTSSKAVMMRHALIDAFKNKAKILIATEAGAEGINLQFCSMVINYDLPWNPQRVEQRIGRCHRYGQKYDVVVVNFCNIRNAADVRVYELLSNKFRLFEGIFGASNDVLGVIDGEGVTFEKRISSILSLCRTPEEINAAFDKLQQDLQDEIAKRRAEAEQAVLENLDEDVRRHLKVDPENAKSMLDENERRFMTVTRQMLGDKAEFSSDDPRRFTLLASPAEGVPTGEYRLKAEEAESGVISYRPNTPLGEWVIEAAKRTPTPYAEIEFDITHHPGRISVLEQLKGKRGFLRLERLVLKSLDNAEYLLFSMTDEQGGKFLEPEIGEALFKLSQKVIADGGHARRVTLPAAVADRLADNAAQYAKATTAQVGEENNEHFKEATEKLIRWSEDQVAAATHKIEVLRSRQLEVERSIRHARTLDEQLPLQKELDTIRKDIRRARANVSTIEDETDEKRHRLLDALQRKLVPEAARETLFTIKWRII